MIAALALVVVACHYHAGGALPDLHCTPGQTRPGVSAGPWDDRPCPATTPEPPARGWPLLVAAARRYRISPRLVVLDRLVPVWAGGTSSPLNLWPLPRRYQAAKRRTEARMLRLCRAGVVSMTYARGLLATDWRAATAYADWAEHA